MGWVLVLLAVPGEERHATPPDLSDRDGPGWWPVRGLDGALLDPLEERVEPGASEDPDLRVRQAVFSFAADVGSVFFLPSPDSDPESPFDPESVLGLDRESVA
jgi:hypothetical protein